MWMAHYPTQPLTLYAYIVCEWSLMKMKKLAYHQICLQHFVDVRYNFNTVADEKYKNHVE